MFVYLPLCLIGATATRGYGKLPVVVSQVSVHAPFLSPQQQKFQQMSEQIIGRHILFKCSQFLFIVLMSRSGSVVFYVAMPSGVACCLVVQPQHTELWYYSLSA